MHSGKISIQSSSINDFNASEIDGTQLKALFTAGTAWLKVHASHVDALNVFPVPDGDTGTNMWHTLRAAVQALPAENNHAGQVAQQAAHGALMGARGNSGVILSQILQGFAQASQPNRTLNTQTLALALQSAAEQAHKAVPQPVPGTILTVVEAVAQTSQSIAPRTRSIGQFLAQVVESAQETLQHTPALLPVLQEANVVDSGGQGLVYFLAGMLRAWRGQPLENANADTPSQTAFALMTNVGPLGYDVQFLLSGNNLNVAAIRQAIGQMGECPLVVGDENRLKIHVHVANPGQPLSYGIGWGNLTNIVIENMDAQHQQYRQGQADALPPAKTSAAEITVISLATGAGLQDVFRSLGAESVISAEADTLHQTIEATAARQILVLSNSAKIDKIEAVAQQAAQLNQKAVYVVPAKTVPQGISAMLAFNPQQSAVENLRRMRESLALVETISLAKADDGSIVGQHNGQPIAHGNSDADVCLQILATIGAANHEILTIYIGQRRSLKAAQTLAKTIQQAYPALEIETLAGGQMDSCYLISLE